ncbi:MAG TPA: hypothetical protein PLZ42_00640 [Methanothrix sp.]|nr:hypothetical protein [Methanothrix sp.]
MVKVEEIEFTIDGQRLRTGRRAVANMTLHSAGTPINVLNDPALDPVATILELKECAEKLSKADGD